MFDKLFIYILCFLNLLLIFRKVCFHNFHVMWSIYEMIQIRTAVVDEIEEWSSQSIFQFKQLERRSLKKSGLQRDSSPWPPRIPVRCSTNWAMKPHIGCEVNLLTSYQPWGVKWGWSIWFNKLTSLPMCGFIAQLVEHRTGISPRSRVRIPLKPWFSSGFFFPIA